MKALRRALQRRRTTSTPSSISSTVWDIHRNRFYTGKSRFDGGWVEGQHEAVVSDELSESANARSVGSGPREAKHVPTGGSRRRSEKHAPALLRG